MNVQCICSFALHYEGLRYQKVFVIFFKHARIELKIMSCKIYFLLQRVCHSVMHQEMFVTTPLKQQIMQYITAYLCKHKRYLQEFTIEIVCLNCLWIEIYFENEEVDIISDQSLIQKLRYCNNTPCSSSKSTVQALNAFSC